LRKFLPALSYMNIWSKVLVVLILLATLPFLYLSMMTLKVNANWRAVAMRIKDKDLPAVINGSGAPPSDDQLSPINIEQLPTLSIEQLEERLRKQETAIHDVLVDRGRVWYNAMPKVDFAKGAVVVQIDSPSPHGILDKTVLYAFDARPKQEGGAYLGEYKVTGVDEKAKLVELQPTMALLPHQIQHLQNSTKGPWTLYEVMPGDRPDLLAQLPPSELDALLPPDTRKEYAKDGQPAEPGDAPERIVDGKYRRELRDYSVLFHELDRQLSVMRDEQAAEEKDLAAVTTAHADALKQVAFRDAEIKDLQAELDRSNKERAVVTAHRKALAASLAGAKAELRKMLDENQRLAGEITRKQLEAAARIDALTGAVAQ
jgi:hypothetical protein